MRHKDYIDLLRTIAISHVDIAHSDSSMHFARITLNKDPYIGSESQIKEFVNNKSGKLKYPCLLAVSYRGGYVDQRADHYKKVIDGTFILLDKTADGKHDDEELVKDRMEQIGEEIIGYLDNQFDDSSTQFDINNVESEKLSKVGTNLAGAKFYFTIEVPANPLLVFKPEKFS